MNRRDFLRGAGAFVVGARLLGGCGDNRGPSTNPDAALEGTFAFPQGVASGDPRTTSVVLWTRAVKANEPDAAVPLVVEVATDEAFTSIVVHTTITATSDSDHTVRVLVTDLTADATFYYRFIAGSDIISGRTRTAPQPTADVQVNIAWVTCQDIQSGYYHAFTQMIADDEARPEADRIHFVVHLGDVIYETSDEPSSRAIDDHFRTSVLKNDDGSDRIVGPFPSGGGTNKSGGGFARTLDDYRHIYKTFLSDPAFQAVRARWPFIHTWDDHEFTNDCWQSMANYIDGGTFDEGSQTRRINGSRAWFEYIPAQLTGAAGPSGVTQDAKDFDLATAKVVDAHFTNPNADNFVAEPNNVAAVGAITIYRSFRWGKHVELVMTDQRSYRSDHAIPEELPALVNAAVPNAFFDPRNFLPLPIVGLLDQGATANGGSPPATIPGLGLPNPRVASPVGTMLGKEQKAWWKSTMMASDATWKLWGNEVPMMRLLIKNLGNAIGFDRVLDGDGWDGYPTERAELLTFLRTQNIKNVVCLTGDIHAHLAGVLMDNFDSGSPTAVATELATAGISSNSLFSFYESASRTAPAALRALVTVDASADGYGTYTENLNLLVLSGLGAAGTFAGASGPNRLAIAMTQAINQNPHLRYVDSNAQGYGYVKVTATQVEGTLVTVQRPVTGVQPGVKRTATFTIPVDNPAGMSPAALTGEKPFPLT